MFLILSFKHSRPSRRAVVWWRPNRCGYTVQVDAAGTYTREEVDTYGLDDGWRTVAVPVHDVEASAVPVPGSTWGEHLPETVRVVRKTSRIYRSAVASRTIVMRDLGYASR